jgi:putative IMPACT (imprinted ancient) family translation regulator
MKIIQKEYIEEYIIEKSRFIAIISPIDSADKVKDHIKIITIFHKL